MPVMLIIVLECLSKCRVEGGAATARHDVPFLFKAFETGQMRPPRAGTKAAEAPRASTIHEYLDWTFMAAEGADEDDLVRISTDWTIPVSADNFFFVLGDVITLHLPGRRGG